MNGVPAKKACLESDETAATLDNTGNATINSHPLTLDWKHSSEKYNLLIACTGSVACIKLTELLSEIKKCSSKYEEKLNIRIVATNNALKFFDRDSLNVPVIDDCLEWDCWKGRGDPVIHIELRRWAHMLLIAPLDANTLAKIANGLCDNLVTSVVRAWDFNRPVYFCPAMNTYMWDNPLTVQHLNTLKNLLNFREIPCVEKTLICGDKGYGAMAALPMIASVVASEVKKHFAIYTG
uniref:Flavoprotein domain-containing protein n=1 Tax=Romanomermis culicivorax TaxID=13658 RepID=A0A915HZ62_ROMCU